MGSGVFLPSGLVLFTFSYNYYDVLRLMNILILRYNLSCTTGRYEGKPVIFITGESVAKLLADLINLPTLFILVQKQYTDIFKNKLFICDHSADHTGNP
jgi:LAGLIDADG DNA endonuclease family